jgi:hypothetical protein
MKKRERVWQDAQVLYGCWLVAERMLKVLGDAMASSLLLKPLPLQGGAWEVDGARQFRVQHV